MADSFNLPKEIILGEGALAKLGEVAREIQSNHLFIITGTLMTHENMKDQVLQSISEHGLKATFYTHQQGEPNTDHLDNALYATRNHDADCVVAIGGGSVIDLAKIVSAFAIHKEMSLDDIPNQKILTRLPLIAIPTTAGTGSEATKVAVITESKSNVKKNPAHSSLTPDIAILDPHLTATLPRNITAYTGMDALAHALEAYVSTRASTMSDHFALEGVRLIGEFLPKVYQNQNDLESREQLLLGSCYAGIAFSNASTNLAHATARPLGARFHIPHGLSVALLLPFVVEFGLEVCEKRYADVAKKLGVNKDTQTELAKEVLNIVWQYNSTFSIWSDALKYFDSTRNLEEKVPILVQDALAGNGIMTNRKIPSTSDVEKIYKDLLKTLQTYEEKSKIENENTDYLKK